MPMLAFAQPFPPGPPIPSALEPPDPDSMSLTLAWDPSPDTGIEFYQVYTGIESGVYFKTTDAGTNLTVTVTGLEPDTLYFFAATATGTNQLVSDFSNEITYRTPVNPPAPPQTLGVIQVKMLEIEIEGSKDAGSTWTNISKITLIIESDQPSGLFRSKLTTKTVDGIHWDAP